MPRRRLLFAIPAAATFVVAVVLLGPGQPKSVVVVRLFASELPAGSLRLMAAERLEGQEVARPATELAVFVGEEGSPRWTGRTGPSGAAELVLDPPVTVEDVIRVVSGDDSLLEGRLDHQGTEAGARVVDKAVTAQSGTVTLRLAPERGLLVPPFAERVRVRLTENGLPLAGTFKMTAISADPGESDVTLENGQVTLDVTAIMQPVRLSFERGATSVEASLPVSMTGVYVAPTLEDDAVVVMSPGPRARAYLSFHDRQRRIGGELVELSLDDRGFFRGHSSRHPPEGTVAIVASGEANEGGNSTAVWPTPGLTGAASAPELRLALDGTRPQLERQRQRARLVRAMAVGIVALAAVLELALLFLAAKQERAQLARLGKLLEAEGVSDPEDISADAVQNPPASRDPLVLVTAIGALVLLSFAGIALLVLR